MKFNIGQRVKIIKDDHGGYFLGSEGTIDTIGKNKNDEIIYGILFYKIADELLASAGIEDTIYYFSEDELECINNIDIEYIFIKGE